MRARLRDVARQITAGIDDGVEIARKALDVDGAVTEDVRCAGQPLGHRASPMEDRDAMAQHERVLGDVAPQKARAADNQEMHFLKASPEALRAPISVARYNAKWHKSVTCANVVSRMPSAWLTVEPKSSIGTPLIVRLGSPPCG